MISPQTGLYSDLLGQHWLDLHPFVRCMHVTGKPLTRTGTFRVRRGTSAIARIAQMLLGLPRTSESSPVTLRIEPNSQGERWIRRIGDVTFVTTQASAGNLLRERVGIVDLYFSLRVVDNCLHYHQTAAKLPLGLLSIALPRWLAPHVVASETPKGDRAVDISVLVSLPMVGLLVAYEGQLSTEPPT